MTPKEKADELHVGYWRLTNDSRIAKQCALVAVGELIESHLILTTTHESEPSIRCKTYWQLVKQEIESI
jgi:hypothetical protein